MRNNRNDWLSIDVDRSVEEKFEKYYIQKVRKFKGKERKGEMTMMYKMIWIKNEERKKKANKNLWKRKVFEDESILERRENIHRK